MSVKMNYPAQRPSLDMDGKAHVQQGACGLRVTELKTSFSLRGWFLLRHITNAYEVQNIWTACTETSTNYLGVCSASVSLRQSVGSRCFALGVVFRALQLLRVSGSRLRMKRTQNTSTLSGVRRVFTADRSLPPFFFFFPNHPDYRLSASARIPFLTHQNGDIHLKDDICGEFPNNLIVIRRKRGRRGRYDGGE